MQLLGYRRSLIDQRRQEPYLKVAFFLMKRFLHDDKDSTSMQLDSETGLASNRNYFQFGSRFATWKDRLTMSTPLTSMMLARNKSCKETAKITRASAVLNTLLMVYRTPVTRSGCMDRGVPDVWQSNRRTWLVLVRAAAAHVDACHSGGWG